MTRETLPNRRHGEAIVFECEGFRYRACISRFSDGRLAEVFLDASKPGTGVAVADMPVLLDGPSSRRAVNGPLLAEIIYRWHAAEAFVEYVGARPGEGPTGAFAFGRSRGVVEGVCAAAGLPVAFITPPVWKRAVGIAPGKAGAKDAARLMAQHAFSVVEGER
jgi:hypothetical protein